uniref:Uncharacterized protein n=1 Tax=Acrobeloides nanus TaxID=290746 RepID=A0A914EBJ5_9BILA
LSVNGYMAFATVLDQGPTIHIGPDATDWPQQQDPAMIAPYLCKQQILQNGHAAFKAGVHYRVILRQSMIGQSSGQNIPGYEGAQPYQGQGYPSGQTQYSSNIYGNLNYGRFQKCPGTGENYVRCDSQGDNFLDVMMQWLQEGVAGATAFRADAAVVVTWHNTASALAGRSDIDSGQTATYQVIWLTDQPARLSYVIINYEHLGFDAADIRMGSRSGRCVAGFNGGNHTGFVPVDPSFMYKNTPKVLAQRSGVPHMVRGRYMFRVDDVVRPGGCSNKTGGTFPLLIYPNIVNMLGEMSVDVNGMCLDRAVSYVLMIERRQTATCTVLNPAVARCNIPKVYAWGTLTVYFQPQSGLGNDEKAFVGYIYFVPPTLDPMRLDIGNIYDWYKNPLPSLTMPISWYPRNFTNPELIYQMESNTGGGAQYSISQDQLYNVQLGLYVIGYKEARDDQIRKFRPEHRVLARLTTYSNMNNYNYRWLAQKERINVYQVEQWYMTDWERMNELFTYRTGYLKLAPLQLNAPQSTVAPQLLSGLVSSPISLHWLWSTNDPQYQDTTFSTQDQDARTAFVTKKATEMCHDWYDEDGAQWNFIRDTETNASCPCTENQAKYDIGRFMPHPRCSQTFRDITCTSTIGAKNCYMSASSLYSSYAGPTGDFFRENYGSADNIGTGPGPQHGPHNAYGSGANSKLFPTHYGQVCCYDENGFLMQSSYQPVVKVMEETPYNPGFPLRAYEFGTNPYMGQFEVPGLSAFHHDYAPYFLCCKYAKFRCQLFYWRRPSSGCQNYQPPAIGESSGGGTFFTIDNQKFIFNEPGVYNYLYIPQTQTTPEVKIQIRLERYPNRKVDFSLLGRSSLGQSDLVEPSNITVITGVAIEATGTDRVHVLARKDTRRFRYRTSVIVGNILRYFDTMLIQKFKGVLVYVNNVERGQPEVYVVLEEPQIGIRIRESYSLDIDRMLQYQESMGLLDLTVSVPPKYGVRPDGDNSQQQQLRQVYNLPRVAGVIRPFPDQEMTGSLNQPLQPQDVNNDMYRQQIISQYLIPGSGEPWTNQNVQTNNMYGLPTENMFTTSKDEDKKFEVFPEVYMKSGPIYAYSSKYQTIEYRFNPITGSELQNLIQTCIGIESGAPYNPQPMTGQIYGQYARNFCPDKAGEIFSICGENMPCLYDATIFNTKILGQENMKAYDSFAQDRLQAIRQYNSCGPVNIEYPEFLVKTPALSSGYLQGDTLHFECSQTHWIKGDHDYKCSIVVDHNDPYNYRFEWNKGWQPWCRTREFENFIKWMTAIFATLAIILVFVMIFLCCWCVKRKRLAEKEQEYKRISPDEMNVMLPYEPRQRFQSQEADTLPRKADSMSNFDGRKYGEKNGVAYTDSFQTGTLDIRSRKTQPNPKDEEDYLPGRNTSV